MLTLLLRVLLWPLLDVIMFSSEDDDDEEESNDSASAAVVVSKQQREHGCRYRHDVPPARPAATRSMVR